MKFLIAAFALFASSVSFAELKPVGTFVPSLCGVNDQDKSLCFGRTVGYEGEYVSIQLEQGTEIFRITRKTPVNGGINPAFSAEKIQLRGKNQNAAAFVQKHSRRGVSSVTVTLSNGESSTFVDFQAVFTTL